MQDESKYLFQNDLFTHAILLFSDVRSKLWPIFKQKNK